MKTLITGLLVATFAGATIACSDGAKDAQADTGSVSGKLAVVQPQMSRAPAATPSKTIVRMPNATKTPTPTTATVDTKKVSSGG